jgi:tRNA uridine 5-carbamoylmethylation protein Kti12
MSLSMIQKPKTVAPIITLVGTPGVGKTTLAALFPKPVFIQAEEITGVFDDWDEENKPDSFPVLKRADAKRKTSTKEDLLSQLRALITEEHDYKTLVIDSITSLHSMFEHEVCENYGRTVITCAIPWRFSSISKRMGFPWAHQRNGCHRGR